MQNNAKQARLLYSKGVFNRTAASGEKKRALNSVRSGMASLSSYRSSDRGRGGSGRGGSGRGGSGRGGSGRGGSSYDARTQDGGEEKGKSHKPSPLYFQKLQRMATADPTVAVLDLLKHEEQLQNLLEDGHIKEDYIQLLLKILANVYNTHMKESLIKILALFPNTAFLQNALPRYIMQLPLKSRNSKPEQHIKNILLFFDQLLRRFPDLYTEIPLDSLVVATMNLDSDIKSEISEQVEELVAVRKRIMENKLRSRNAREKKKYVEEDEAKPPDDFRQLSVHPTSEDFKTDKEVFLRKNIVHGKYQNVDHYLDVQFRLLREDFIGPLREGVSEISQGVVRNERNQNLRVYRDVVIVDTVCTNSGIVYTIRFDTRHLQKVNWESSKRLIFGAFLCMSQDNFNTLVFSTITERKAELLKDGYLQVRFFGDLPDLRAGDRFQMVESPGYYEAYCHNLQGLQEMNQQEMPFKRYLVDCETEVHVPGYLTEKSEEEEDPEVRTRHEAIYRVHAMLPHRPSMPPTYNMQEALQAKVNATAVPVLDIASWPTVEEVQLNQSQLEAIQAALTKEFVVIQGPPGTGKTYVGLRIAQALLNNSGYWHKGSPMLVVCYTNHALDQFLEGILEFKKDGIVRVGGRSSSESLREYNLSNKARRTAAWYVIHDDIVAFNVKITNAKACLAKSYSQLLGLEDLSSVMEKREVDQLVPYIYVALYMGTTVIGAWMNMQQLPQYAPPSLGSDGMFGGVEWLGEEDDEDDDDEEDQMEKEDTSDNNAEHLGEQGAADETIDVEKDAERLQGEREVGDDFAPIEKPEDAARMGMTQDYINMVNLRAQRRRIEEPREKANIYPAGQSLWALDPHTRQRLYQHWVRLYQENHAMALSELCEQYNVVCEQAKEVKHGQEEDVLRSATVIGMTTTGAAKYRNVLQKIKPKIIVVEEAAEVLEAHIITALSSGAQHLIMIGDHKQLKPNPSVYALAKQYNLEVSLFERMVTNGVKCYTLDTQHRMRPEISLLMKHIYDDLKNHVSVEAFKNIEGISKNIFFIDHQHPEKTNEELRSHANEHEAEYIVALCRYLLRQGYDSSRITVLTTYTGQLLQLKRSMPKSLFSGVRVCSVDNFQGEENDIILLSLVRSNEERRIGFLGVSNRICVALSRARMGFYCIGNISMLAERSELWSKIKADLEEQNSIGPALTIYCRNHKVSKIDAASAQDFKKAPEGGCTLPCDFRLDCGHKCEMACHPVDQMHLDYVCGKICDNEVCSLKHRCAKKCHFGEPCGDCEKLVTKTLEKCSHKLRMPCSTNTGTYVCTLPCEKTLQCGHPCRSPCGKLCDSSECQEQVKKILRCGHEHSIECSTLTEGYKCDVGCKTILDCEHPCPGNCHDCKEGRVHVACQHPCGRTLICSHPCNEPCTKDCPQCERECENRCMHSACRKKCGEACVPCQEPCTWQCKHKKCKKKCSEICDRPPCNYNCRKKLTCGKKHKCVGLCGEKCPKLCRACNKKELTEIFFGTEDKPRANFIELLDCGHVFEVTALDQWMACKEDDVTSIQLKKCPKCKTPIRKSLRYGNAIKKTLMDIELVKKKVLDEEVDKKTKIKMLVWAGRIKKKYRLFLQPCEDVYEDGRHKVLDAKFQRNIMKLEPEGLLNQNSAYYDLLHRILSCTNKELSAVKNQILLLPCIYEIKTTFLERIPESRAEKRLRGAVNDLEKRLVDSKLSNRMVTELKEEIARVTLECKVKIMEEDIPRSVQTASNETRTQLDVISQLLSSTKKIEKSRRDEIHKQLDDICERLGLGLITPEERAKIVKAIGLTKGHWFKCRNGHIYAIGECGGATETGKCPECHEAIGGGDHKLEAGNELAPEMDGARHAAWSDQANLENYDQEELRRLQMF